MNNLLLLFVKISRNRHQRKCYFAILLLVILNMCIIFWFQSNIKVIDIGNLNIIYPNTIKSPPSSYCVIPQFTDRLSDKLKLTFNLTCNNSEPNWLNLFSGKLYYSSHLNSSKFNSHGGVNCMYLPLRASDDYSTYYGEALENVKNGSGIDSDFFITNCKTSDDELFFEMIYAGIALNRSLQIHRKHQRNSYLKSQLNSLDYNVIILGIDSVSHLAFQKFLPKTYNTFKSILKGVDFEKYNIIGDGTTPNLLAMLTGFKETELYEARKNFKNATFVDNYPWIWNAFKRAGYITQWTEEGAKYGTFQHRLKGFKSKPTDHYMRPYFLRAESSFYDNYKWGCLGNNPRHKITLDWLREAFKVYDSNLKKFSFIFLSELSHENNLYMSPLDNDLKDLLLEFKSGRLFQESILILMSDHGHRYASSRSTFRGKYEERLPFLGIALPPSLRVKFPNIQKNLYSNKHQLVTLFDVHATLISILNFEAEKVETGVRTSAVRSVSLFYKHKDNRTCFDIGIDDHWCVCLRWIQMNKNHSTVNLASRKIIEAINNITADYRSICSSLTLQKVISAEKYSPSESVLKFKGSRDPDGRIADFSDGMKSEQEVFRITLMSQPGLGEYEATIYFNAARASWFINPKDISRTNRYVNQTGCLQNRLPQLSKFCMCR